jgi:hypothetical protein
MEKKLELIRQYFEGVSLLDEDYCEDVYGYSGGNIDDAYSLGLDYGSSNIAKDILAIIKGDE